MNTNLDFLKPYVWELKKDYRVYKLLMDFPVIGL